MNRRTLMALALTALTALTAACARGPQPERASVASRAADPVPAPEPAAMSDAPAPESPAQREIATFGAGCFWCVEAVLEQLDGVLDVTSGYMGGHVDNPSYKQVCSGNTGHAEVVQVTFDPTALPYEDLLAWFWRLHDPTTLNRQGADVGTQYRSAIFCRTPAQREAALRVVRELEDARAFGAPIVTEIAGDAPFYPAEGHHQDYFERNPAQPYCMYVVAPKLAKFRKSFRDRLKQR